jgi:hypothetical protein
MADIPIVVSNAIFDKLGHSLELHYPLRGALESGLTVTNRKLTVKVLVND